MNQRTFFLSVLALLTCSLQAQTKKAATGSYQLQKGRWMISHSMVKIAPTTYRFTDYDQNNKITRSYKRTGTDFSIFFSAPNWGNFSVGGYNSKSYDDANKPVSNDNASGFNIYINPSAGYFIQDRLLLGAQLVLGYYGSNIDNSNTASNNGFEQSNKYTTVGIGPEIRYYFGNIASRQLFHAGISSSLTFDKSKDEFISIQNNKRSTTNREFKSTTYSITPYVGSSWKLGNHWLLESALFSTIGSYDTESESVDVSVNNVTTRSRGSSTTKYNSVIGARLGFSYTF
jgi:hypothetical protein